MSRAHGGRGFAPETRRILLDGAIVQVIREGDELLAQDGRRVSCERAVHLPPVEPSKIICAHLNYRNRLEQEDGDGHGRQDGPN